MRRRPRIDLGQGVGSDKESKVLERKQKRWAERNRDRPDENPFIKAIRPEQSNYGDPQENPEDLRQRLANLEFGNFPGYFNYRKKAVTVKKDEDGCEDTTITNGGENGDQNEGNIDESLPTSDKIGAANGEASIDNGLSDERIKIFQKSWFEGKNVLDIGCNRGHITYAIARVFSPKSIIGIDIDVKMINMANKDLHLHLKEGIIKTECEKRRSASVSEEAKESEKLRSPFPLTSYIAQGPIVADLDCLSLAKHTDQSQKSSDLSQANSFPNNLVFVEHNYVPATDELVKNQKPHFDTIVCLSVTKWIHLNYGDQGLKRFFKRIYRHLLPGGLFVLEAQPFDNYGRRKRLSDRLKANYYNIQFKPDEFDAYLMSDEVGFQRIIYETTTEHECPGFKRPIKVYMK